MNKKKDILLLCQYFYPEHVSSAILPAQLAEELVSSDYNVNVICGWAQEYHDGRTVPKTEIYNGINIYRTKYARFNNKNKIGRLINFFSFFISVSLKIPKILRHDIVLVYSNPPILPLIGYWVKKLGKIKLIFVGFDLYPDNAIAINAIKADGIICKLMSYINKRIYLYADKVVAISEDMKSYMMETHKQLEQERTVVIPNWYTGELQKTNLIVNEDFKSIRERWKLIVLYTGNMGEAQELDTIIDSIIQINNFKIKNDVFFIFTGHGSRQKEMEQRLRNNNIKNIKFYDFLKGQDYNDILNIADVCLVSLKKGIEGLGVPSKTYGYFAYAKPVISIMSEETELAKNIISYKAGFNIQQGDVKGFINIINTLIDNPKLIYELSVSSYRIHKDLYQKDISLNKYKDMVNELIKR